MMLAFPPGMKTGFTMKGWKSMLKVTATRTSDAVLHLELQSPGPGGVGKEKAVTLRIGETVTVVPGKDVDVAAVGGNRAPVRCAWLELGPSVYGPAVTFPGPIPDYTIIATVGGPVLVRDLKLRYAQERRMFRSMPSYSLWVLGPVVSSARTGREERRCLPPCGSPCMSSRRSGGCGLPAGAERGS